MKRLVVVVSVISMSLWSQVVVSAAPPSQVPPCKEGAGPIEASELPRRIPPGVCSIAPGRPITDVGAGIEFPARGMKVRTEAISTTGSNPFEIWHLTDGTIELYDVGPELTEPDLQSSGGGGGSSPGECDDGAYDDKDEKIDETHNWYYRDSTDPAELYIGDTVEHLRQAGINHTHVNNNCGRADNVSASLNYSGYTDAAANLNSSGTSCDGDGNSQSVVEFGDLPWPNSSGVYVVATECSFIGIERFGYDEIRETDVRLNKVEATWTTTPLDSSCSGKYDLQSVMTHERGHSLGLGHPGGSGGESSHANLTMSPKINGTCQRSERSLGKGDYLGLEQKY